MRKIDMIVIHCTATRADSPLSPAELTRMHRKRGFKCCGYHYYVRTDGEICTMRPVERAGAHARGYNERSIGIAYEGDWMSRAARQIRARSCKSVRCGFW